MEYIYIYMSQCQSQIKNLYKILKKKYRLFFLSINYR